MAILKFPYLKDLKSDNPEGIIQKLVKSGTKFPIDRINWPEYPYKPQVEVCAGFSDEHLWLHYLVKEDYIRAEGKKDQDPVWQDTCVEFFVQVGDDYRNFEFNCIGFCLSAIGPTRNGRKSMEKDKLSRIIRYPSLNPGNPPSEGSQCDWTLTVGIPLDLIGLDSGKKFRCNFFKCGDKTKIPHFVTWAPVDSPAPDFHIPEFFGEVELGVVGEW